MIIERDKMKQEVLHDNLLKAIREKIPHEENLANVLGNLLCIGKEDLGVFLQAPWLPLHNPDLHILASA